MGDRSSALYDGGECVGSTLRGPPTRGLSLPPHQRRGAEVTGRPREKRSHRDGLPPKKPRSLSTQEKRQRGKERKGLAAWAETTRRQEGRGDWRG